MSQIVETQPGFDKKVWRRFESEGKKQLKSKNYGLYRNIRLNMAQYLQSIKDYSKALAMYSEVLFWDLTGCENNFEYNLFLEITFPMLFSYENSLMMIAPGVIREMEKCKKKLGLNDEQLRNIILQSINTLKAPVHIFTYSEIADMYFWERDDKKTQMKNVFASAKKRFDPKKPQAISKLKN
ncbi:MAG: hypothetical protein NC452_03885 [Eubacterium sp.]|nr:hypothetical protein [Eubacterium sp.]